MIDIGVLVEQDITRVRELDPQFLWRFPPQHVADLRPDYVGEPIHFSLRIFRSELPASRKPSNIWRSGTSPPSSRSGPIHPAIAVYSATSFAPRTPFANEAARPATLSTVLAPALPSASRLRRQG